MSAGQTTEPAFVYDPDNWEATYDWRDRGQLAEDLDIAFEWEKPKRVCTLLQGPDKWIANVTLTRDDDGDPDETEIQWFDTEEEAVAAMRGPGFT